MKITNFKIVSGSIGAGKVVRVKVTVRKKGRVVRKYVKRRAYTYCDIVVEFDFSTNERFGVMHYFSFANNPSVAFMPFSISKSTEGNRYAIARICSTQHKHALSFPFSDEIIVVGKTQPRGSENPKPNSSYHFEQPQGEIKTFDPHIESDEFIRETFGTNPDKAPFESSDFPEEGTPFFNREIIQKGIDYLKNWHGNENYTRRFDGGMVLRTVTYNKHGNFYTCKVWTNNELVSSKNHHFDNMLDAQKYCDSLPEL